MFSCYETNECKQKTEKPQAVCWKSGWTVAWSGIQIYSLHHSKGNLNMTICRRKPLPGHSSQKGCKEARSPWQLDFQQSPKRINKIKEDTDEYSNYQIQYWSAVHIKNALQCYQTVKDLDFQRSAPRIDLSDESLYIICQGICTLDRWSRSPASNTCNPLNREPTVNPLHSESSWCCCTHNCAKYCSALGRRNAEWSNSITFWNKSNKILDPQHSFSCLEPTSIHRWSISTSKSRAWKCWSTLAGPSDRLTNLPRELGEPVPCFKTALDILGR